MIQRIQSVYLFFAVISLAVMFFFPLASFIGGDKDQLILYVYKLLSEVPDSKPDVPSWFILPNLILAVLSLLISFAAIFLYKNRQLQIKMVRFTIVLLLAFIAVFFFYYVPAIEEISGVVTPEYDKVGATMPLIAFVFLILAYRGIQSDEKLIRSADRLR